MIKPLNLGNTALSLTRALPFLILIPIAITLIWIQITQVLQLLTPSQLHFQRRQPPMLLYRLQDLTSQLLRQEVMQV